MKACFQFWSKGYRRVSGGSYIALQSRAAVEVERTQLQEVLTSCNITYLKKMKACFRFSKISYRGVSRGSYMLCVSKELCK